MWLYVPGIDTSSSAQDTADSDSGLTLRSAEALSRWCTSSGKSLSPQSWRRKWKRDNWLQRLSGLTCEPSTLDRGVASWMASLAASHASRTATPASAAAPPTSATYGTSVSESYAMPDPDGASSRMWEQAFGSITAVSDLTLQRLATASRRSSSRRRMWARRTAASGYSSSQWTTPRASHDAGSHDEAKADSLDSAAKLWQAPAVADVEGGRKRRGGKRGGELLLNGQAAQWPTPRVQSANGAGLHGEGGIDLQTAAKQWPTPTARDWKDGSPPESVPTNGLLGRLAPRMPLPGSESSPSDRTSRRQLNQLFVEWLMGLPEGWTSVAPTDCARSVTE